MPFPSELWEWPLLAAFMLLIAWLLWTQREERRRYEARTTKLLDAAEEDRRSHLLAWDKLVREQVLGQHEVVAALGKMCIEVDRLSTMMREQHAEILARCGDGKAER